MSATTQQSICRGAITLIALLATLSCMPVKAQTPKEDPVPEIVKITIKGSLFGSADMVTEVFKPTGSGPFPVLLYSHGRAGSQVERANMSAPIARGHVRYWLQRGFAVVAPIRPGYGATGGGDREISGAQFDALGNCTSDPDYRHAADAAVAVTLSAIEWVRKQDWARPAALVLEGQSMGGLTTVAAAATNPEGVIAYINFAGGVGGSPERAPGKSCGPERMREAMEAFGTTTKVPNLWLYAENDLYWGAEAPKAWHAAFAAGGSPTTFVQTTAVPAADGHQLLLRGGRLWSVHTDAFIKRLGF